MRYAVAGCLLLYLPLAWSASVVDDRGQTVTLVQPAVRIVSLAPNVTELLFAIGAGEHVVGAVDYSDYPPQAQAIPRVGDYAHLDLERIVALKPDLVVGWSTGNSQEDIDELEQLGISVYVTEIRRLADVARQLENLARLSGRDASAIPVAARFRDTLARLRRQYGNEEPLSIFYQVSSRPLYTVNGEHIISEAIALCGGQNVFASLAPLAGAVAVESVLAVDPDVILIGVQPGEVVGARAAWQRWSGLTAVRKGHIYYVEPDVLQRATPRILEGVERVCRNLAAARGRR